MQGLSRIRPACTDLDTKLYSTLLRSRPTQLGGLLKKCLLIRHRVIQAKTGRLLATVVLCGIGESEIAGTVLPGVCGHGPAPVERNGIQRAR